MLILPLPVGTTANTVAAGDDSRLVNALSTTGNGSGLTNLNASALATGTISTNRLPDLSAIYSPVVGNTSLTTVGTIVTGTWAASSIQTIYGGTGANLAATGGANQIVRQSTVGGAFTVSILATADIPSLPASQITSGSFNIARIPTGTTSSTVAIGNDSRIVNALQASNNLGELVSVSTARFNLGLHGAAVLDVGTTTGTVAAGDDSRIVSALSTTGDGSGLASLNASALTSGTVAYARLPVGSAANTITAGDDSRVVGAAQKSSNLSDLASASAARSNLGLGTIATFASSDYLTPTGSGAALTGITESQVGSLVSDLAAKALGLVATTVKTGSYTLSPSDYVPVDASSGSVALTLPTAPADRTRVGVKLVIVSGANTVTITRGGSDVFNKAGGSTSLTLSLLNQAVIIQYNAATSIWYVQSSDTPVSGLDSRYALVTNNLADISSAPTARTNLGLGGAAVLNVGTTTGTVAAGDDSRIVSALSTTGNGSGLTNLNASALASGTVAYALLPIGTLVSTVAAGNDTRITGAAQKASNLSDLASAPTARTNLGLGGAAVLNVGATTGTVAAGDDSRLVNALSTTGNGSGLTNVSAASFQGRAVAVTAPRDGQCLAWNASSNQWEPTDMPSSQAIKTDYQTGFYYVGYAVAGTTTATAAWRISKVLTDSSNNVTDVEWAGGSTSYTNVWDNRASLTYS